jgi:hypothetical protein
MVVAAAKVIIQFKIKRVSHLHPIYFWILIKSSVHYKCVLYSYDFFFVHWKPEIVGRLFFKNGSFLKITLKTKVDTRPYVNNSQITVGAIVFVFFVLSSMIRNS